MGDEGEGPGCTTQDGPQINQDELILAQQRQIEKEISENIALVGDLEPISSLNNEYSTDKIYLEKVKDLSIKYKYIRRTRPDGNCFFRAFSYANIERLLEKKEEYNEFYKLAENSKNRLNIEDTEEARKELHMLFNEQGFSDYMVVYLRLLTSGQLQKDQDFFSCFIEGERTVADFCHQEVEPMYKESDHIHIIAACAALRTGVRVIYMDRGTAKSCTEHDLPEGCTPTVHLLYRPGHYDILYP
ncbi:hypothetical protein NQ314_003028 [Rhamnusium bicolor]|uniref:OTU domain-containing protein n=1 Tax=Rhamnusium bicolor TaxID=1586634 RepID=A0AAV8ZQV3_9CUCU|nr:hypothetical protein NQ314_003028 [Rhamnusium bicolor]